MVEESTNWWGEYWQTHNFETSTPPPKIVTSENWTHGQIYFSDLVNKMFGKYQDTSGGLLSTEGTAIENAVAEILELRSASKRTSLRDHYSSGQMTLIEVITERDMNGPELIVKFISDTDPLNSPRWQQEISFDVLSPTKKPAGYFNRKFDLVTNSGIFEIKTRLSKNKERVKADLNMMAICWPVLKHGLVETIVYPWKKLKSLGPGEHNSFAKVTPKIGPTFAIVGTDGIITGEDIGLNMKMAKEYQAEFYKILLEMLVMK